MSEEHKTVQNHPNRKPIDGLQLKNLAQAGLTWLRTNQQTVNALNVFPVPDGDTGTNMVLTMQSAFDEIDNSPESNVGKMSHSLAHGALMGARGNSGVILSQIWAGFAAEVKGHEILDAPLLVRACQSAVDAAYNAVIEPVEGTLLTVVREATESLVDQAESKDSGDNFPAGANLCGKCNTKAVIQMDGCMTCLNCGDSKCG